MILSQPRTHGLTVLALVSSLHFCGAEVSKVETIAPDVYFHEGDIRGHGHCNNQIAYFVELRSQVQGLIARGKTGAEVKTAVGEIKESLEKNRRLARYVGDMLSGQVEKVYIELGGKPFLNPQAAGDQHQKHASAHGRESTREVSGKKIILKR